MRAVTAWLRVDLRRRGRSLIVLALLLAFSGAIVMAVVAGARRTGTAYERLVAPALSATAVILPNDPTFDWDKVKALPNVASVGLFVLDGMYGVEGMPGDGLGFPNGNAEIYTTVERPVLLAGRLPDNSRPDEVLVTQSYLDVKHAKLGDPVVLRLFTKEQAIQSYEGDAVPAEQAGGPTVRATIVGVGNVAWAFSFGGGDLGPGLLTTYGFFEKYKSWILPDDQRIPPIYNALVRLDHGEADIAQFRTDFAKATGRSDIEVASIAEAARHATNATSFESSALLIFAVVAAIAAAVIVGQAIVRYTAAAVADLDVLRAVGMTPREAVGAAMGGPVLAAAGAAAIAVVLAWLASTWFPIGVARPMEPSPGRDLDAPVAVAGVIVLVLFVAGLAYAAARSALRRSGEDRPMRRSVVATLSARLGLPVPTTLGTRLALEPGRGRTAVPVRPALIGAVAGVLGVVAASTFHAGLTDAVDNPERYGQTYQTGAFIADSGRYEGVTADELTAGVKAVAAMPGVAGVDNARSTPVTIDGHSVTAWELNTIGDFRTVSVEGRAPGAADEIAVAPTTARLLGITVGQRVGVSGTGGPRTLTVTGITFVTDGPHSTYDDGAWLTKPAYDALFPPSAQFPYGFFKFQLLFIHTEPGTDVGRLEATIQEKYHIGVGRPSPPADVVHLQAVSSLPPLLAVFLALLAIGAVGHALATAVRRRRHDMAVIRALGFTRPQVRWTVAWQATTLALIGLVFGIPLGLALGRTAWRVVAERTPVEYVPPVALLALVLVVPAALLLANALAAYPGHRAVRQRIGTVLRAE